jgi:hypothetical protein
LLLPPGRKALVQTDSSLAGLVHRHLVLELAACLGKCARAFVEPFSAVCLDLFGGLCCDDVVNVILLWRKKGAKTSVS